MPIIGGARIIGRERANGHRPQYSLPVAKELIDNRVSHADQVSQTENPTYDPATGQTTPNVTEYAINAGILSRGRNEQGGVAEEYELRLWIHHGPRWVACTAKDVRPRVL